MSTRFLDEGNDLVARRPGCDGLDGSLDHELQADRRGARVDDADVGLGQHPRRRHGRIPGAAELLRDGQDDDLVVRAVQPLKDLQEIAGGRLRGGGQLGGLSQAGVELVVVKLDAFLECLFAKVDTEGHDPNVVLLDKVLG